MKMKKGKLATTYILTAIICLFCIFPVFWMLSCAFRPSSEIYSYGVTFLPQEWTLDAFIKLFTVKSSTVDFLLWMKNSFIVAIAATIVGIVVACLGGYSLSRYRYKGRMAVAYSIVVAQVIPGCLLLIPMYMLMTKLDLADQYIGLIILNISFSVPYCTWMMKGYFDEIPKDLNESAAIDGAGEWKSFTSIIFPLVRPGVAVTAFFSFINSWNEYLFASIMMKSYNKWTLPIGLASFKGQYTVDYAQMMAGGAIITIPIIILFLVLQKNLVSGMTAGAVKS